MDRRKLRVLTIGIILALVFGIVMTVLSNGAPQTPEAAQAQAEIIKARSEEWRARGEYLKSLPQASAATGQAIVTGGLGVFIGLAGLGIFGLFVALAVSLGVSGVQKSIEKAVKTGMVVHSEDKDGKRSTTYMATPDSVVLQHLASGGYTVTAASRIGGNEASRGMGNGRGLGTGTLDANGTVVHPQSRADWTEANPTGANPISGNPTLTDTSTDTRRGGISEILRGNAADRGKSPGTRHRGK